MRQQELLRSVHDYLLIPLNSLRGAYNMSLSGSEKAYKEGIVSGYVKCLTRYEDAMKKHTSDTSEDIRFLKYMLCCVRAYKEVNMEDRIREYYAALNSKITEVKNEYDDVCLFFGECEMTQELESKIEGIFEATCLLLDMFKEVICDDKSV